MTNITYPLRSCGLEPEGCWVLFESLIDYEGELDYSQTSFLQMARIADCL